MRTRTLITGAAFMAAAFAGLGTASAQQALRGSDTLEDVTEEVIANCPGATGNITYVGGGSGAGQSAMAGAAPTQRVAPMSRQLNGAQCTATSRQILVGLDGLSILTKNATGGAPATCTDDIGGAAIALTGIPAQFVPCTTNTQCTSLGTTCDTARQFCVPGGTLGACTAAQGCSPDGTYTFDNGTPTNAADDWQDVIRQIYGGMNHTTAATLIHDATEVNADGTAICFASAGGATRNCKRNPARIDCANPVRGVLLASYGQAIRAPLCTSSSPACVKIKHAFRRDDLSGTTDAFQAIVGLVALSGPTTLRSSAGGAFAPEIADFAAVASPFCNAGTAAMNKGFTDGLDLDPYRRACATGPAPDRLGLESVCQAYAAPTNSDVGCYATGVSPANYPQRELSSPQGRGLLAGGSVNTINALQTATRGATTQPRCLGVVQAVSIPQDLPGQTVWATNRYPQGGACTAGQIATANPLPARVIMCPDGFIKQGGGLCFMPVNTANGRFDCIADGPTPNVLPQDGVSPSVTDRRVWNLMPVNSVGQMAALIDSYQNPNFPGVNQLRRFARRYYGVHMARPDSSQAPATIATNCQQETDTNQIGCLVKASPCSIGFAGREAADSVAPFANLALRVNNIISNTANIENLATAAGPIYPLARKLWFNSFQDPIVGFLTPNLSAAEQALSSCMGLPAVCASDADCTGGTGPCNLQTLRCTGGNNTVINTAISNANFVPVPVGIPRLIVHPTTGNGCPLPL